jgi:protocatechuate 3,4-dioxygenase beta subunit
MVMIAAQAKGFGLEQQTAGRVSLSGRVDFTLQPEGRVSGKVTFGDTGKPAANVRIRVFNQKNVYGTREAVTDREGRYMLENLSTALYTVYLSPRDESGKWAPVSRNDILVKAGETTVGVDFTLAGGGLITGKILDRDTGKPIAGHWVGIKEKTTSERFPALRYALTDREGNFRFLSAPGPVQVFTRPPLGYEQNNQAARDVDAVEGKTVAVEPMQFSRGIILRGVTRTLDGTPQAGVHLYGKGASPVWAVSDKEGKFTISGLSKGEKISFLAFLDTRHLRGSVNLEVTADAGVDILLREYRTVSRAGKVIDTEGKPVPGAKVRAAWWPKDENFGYLDATSYSNGAGEYSFDRLILGEKYHFSAEAAGYVAQGGSRDDDFIAQTNPGPYRDLVLMPANRWMEVHVDDPDGKPVFGAGVQPYGGTSNQSPKLTDTNGNVRFENLAEPMVNSIYISHDDYGHFSFRHVPTNTRNSYRIFRAEKYISGKVVDSAGKPVQGAYVRAEPGQLVSGLTIITSQTTLDGAFHLKQMIQDEVQIIVSHPGYVPRTLDNVRTNQKDLVITLESGKSASATTVPRPQSAGKDSYSVVPIPRSRIAIDGDLADWIPINAEKVDLRIGSPQSHENIFSQDPPSKEVLSATLRCGSDGDFLLLAVDVLDDDSEFGFATFDYLHLQDCVEIIFKGEKAEEPPVQLVVTLDSEGKLLLGGRAPLMKEKFPGFWESAGVRAALRKNPQGYAVEAAVPWSVLEWAGWEEGKLMGLNVRVHDADRKGMNRYLVEWSSDNGEGYRKLLGALRKPSSALFRSPDHETMHAALTALQKKDWTKAEKVLHRSENTLWAKSLLAYALYTAGKEKEGAEYRKQVMREMRSSAIREWGMENLIRTSFALEGKGQYREAIVLWEGVDFSGPKSHLILRGMLQRARCYCLNNEYSKAEPILNEVIGLASEKQIQDIESLVTSAREMMASAERMKTAK